ncbi:Transposon Ty3-G Gag-Pol polyprotein [Vitis vinifera]|uniref:Transposon Ty3-G Gag-Pol polyprotein n=1 Tax=Vitis vinifera TaxID=29760 RepID=A0A438DBV1_VITVI|nr:Transposon Ty3-G Gag-Pol polyprotein [Vitis vinifera]
MHTSYHVTVEVDFNSEFSEDELGKAPQVFEDGGQATVDELKEANLGTNENPRPIYVTMLLSPFEEKSYFELLLDYKDVFAWSYKEMLGLDPKVAVHQLMGGKVLDMDANIILVKKKNGHIRVCVDLRDLNNACPKDDFPLPIIKLMVDATTGHEALFFMDGSSSYNQIRMAPRDEELTTFRTLKGIYYYKVMPFGLKNSRKREDHQRDLRMVFDRLRRYQLKMNPLKCAFGVTFGKFLEFIVQHRGIEVDQSKLTAIRDMPELRNLQELRSLQGCLAFI